jgi:hypothetical protein
MHWDRRARVLYFGKLKAKKEQVRWLMDGTRVLPLRLLKSCGFSVSWDGARRMARLRHKDRELWVRRGVKRVAVNRRAQRMRAWQGDRLLLDSHVSTGARGYTTPAGSFMAGPFKSPMAISHKYGDSPMPWCVQVHNNVCIHGYHSVPPRPASHGCIRVPLRGQNPARWFYQWVDVGTPVTVGDRWPAPRAVI